jgi:hypothetical protein
MLLERKSKILLLQGPTSGGKSTFVYGTSDQTKKGYLSYALSAFLAAQQSSDEHLHILFSALEIREDDVCYDLLSEELDIPVRLDRKGSKATKTWTPTGAQELLITSTAQFGTLLETIKGRLVVGDNGIHRGSSRGFTLYKIVSVVYLRRSWLTW